MYPEIRHRKTLVSYTWYRSEADYNKVTTNDTNIEKECKTYENWKVDSEKRLTELSNMGAVCLKIAIIPKNYMKWLKENGFENTSEIRERYAVSIYESACKNGIVNEV